MIPESRILKSLNPPSPEPGTVLVETERLILRRYFASDAAAFAAAANYPEVIKTLSDRWTLPIPIEKVADFIANSGKGHDPAYPTHAAILLKPHTDSNLTSEPVLIGGFAFHPQGDVAYRTWTMGYLLTPPAWGKGYATEAIGAATRFALGTWPQLCRIEAEAYSNNPASVRVLEKCGFVKEGVRRCAAEKNGEMLDLVLLSLIRSDLGLS